MENNDFVIQNNLRKIPSIDSILSSEEVSELIKLYPRDLVKSLVKEILDALRNQIKEGLVDNFSQAELVTKLKKKLHSLRLRRVINGTGVILHTNLGRAFLSSKAAQKVFDILTGYSNLEYDLSSGERGKRTSYVEYLLKLITSAEDCFVVNNNAGAILLVLSALMKEREVIVSRGELVEIGGSFRIPEVMSQSGAIMVEVGTTNKTRLADYEKALTPQTAGLLKVHTSNYQIIGFSESVSLKELVELSKKYNLMVVEDLGSGLLQDFSLPILKAEPSIIESLSCGVDVLTFSGDKLLGGPQCGIILGKKVYLEKIKKHPLSRALRVDKLVLASLEATLESYLEDKNICKEIPVLNLLSLSVEELKVRGEKILEKLGDIGRKLSLKEGFSTVGGGSLPTSKLPTVIISFNSQTGKDSNKLFNLFREAEPPVIGFIEKDSFNLDLRTVLPQEEQDLIRIIKEVF